jgi:hypothetical protein
VDARDRDASPGCVVANCLSGCGRNLGDILGDGEWRDFDGVVTGLAGEAHRILQFPVFENLVADPELHCSEDRGYGAEVQAARPLGRC